MVFSAHVAGRSIPLKKLAGPHLPATLAQLKKAISRVHHDATRSKQQPRDTAAVKASPNAEDAREQSGQEASQHESADLVDGDSPRAK